MVKQPENQDGIPPLLAITLRELLEVADQASTRALFLAWTSGDIEEADNPSAARQFDELRKLARSIRQLVTRTATALQRPREPGFRDPRDQLSLFPDG